MSEPSVDNAILLVTGAGLTAELMDRPLAYRLKDLIDEAGDVGAGLMGVVLSDIWYLNTEALHGRPVISVGGPGVNALSQYLYRRLPGALVIEGLYSIQQDVTYRDLRACLWGMNHETTVEAVETYVSRGYLADFIHAAWAEPQDPADAAPEAPL